MTNKNLKLLLADDEELFAQMLKDILTKAGYSPEICFRGDDAIDMVKKQNFDVILTDIRMPGASGLDVLCEAKKKDGDVQVIVISAYGDADNILEALRQGATDFLPKPIETPSLIPSIIDRAWEKRRLLVENRELTAHLAKRNKELEEALEMIKKQQEELVHLERLKVIGTMAAGIAHEINNPLAFISTNVQSLEKYLDYINDFFVHTPVEKERLEKIRTDLKNIFTGIRNGVTRVSQITMALRAFSRKEPSTLIDISVNECVNDALSLLTPRLKKSNIILTKELVDTDKTIKANRQNLIHAIMNFVQNACDAMENTQNPAMEVITSIQEDQLTLLIRDNGTGVPKDAQGKIFDPFFSTKPTGKGTGLGLSIALGVIEESGGRITFESAHGKGSSVSVTWKI